MTIEEINRNSSNDSSNGNKNTLPLIIIRMSLDFDIRFDLKSISSHARRGCCSQPGASLEIDFKSLKGGMSRHKQGLKIDFTCFLVHSPRAT